MKMIEAKEIATLIKDGDNVVITGFVGFGIPEHVILAVEQSYLETQHPCNLRLIWNSSLGDGSGKGVEHLAHEGLVSGVVASHLNLLPNMQRLVDTNKIKAHMLPLGTISQLLRASGTRKPGLLTKIGLGTYVDPRVSGGKANECTTEDIIEVINFQGQDYLLYHALPVDVAILRASVADKRGNLSFGDEAVMVDAMASALAAKSNGGIVIAQVSELCERGEINPRNVLVPGCMVDYVVVAPQEEHPIALSKPEHDPALAQKCRISMEEVPKMELTERKIIARRAALELYNGAVVNLGLGIPEGIAVVAAEEGISEDITLTVESGHVGGVPTGGKLFGGCYNADFMTDITQIMDWYEAGALNVAFLGAAEVDQEGNVNVTKFGKTVGPGGFINISQTAKKVCFCGSLMAGGCRNHVEDGVLVIDQEGRTRKYVEAVQQISFSGKTAVQQGQDVLYITERAVFQLTEEGLLLVEIAPGLDVEKDVLNCVDFQISVSPELKEMDSRIFRDEPMGLCAEFAQ